jgi:hypothetical protein
MDVIIIRIPRHTHPWRWEAAPTVPPTPPSVPRSCAGFRDPEKDAERAGHRVTEVRENMNTHEKRVVRGPRLIAKIQEGGWRRVASEPHDDGDFSYMCGREYCRCSS